jgi:hypothetical protein
MKELSYLRDSGEGSSTDKWKIVRGNIGAISTDDPAADGYYLVEWSGQPLPDIAGSNIPTRHKSPNDCSNRQYCALFE